MWVSGLEATYATMAWRDQRDFTARKYSMWQRGEKFLSQVAAR
jgi:hypothetical protein